MKTQELDKSYILQTYNKADVEFVSGNNAKLIDINDKQYIDFTSGIGVCSVGHANKQVNDAIVKQISNITHISNLYYNAPQAKLAKTLVELSGYDMQCFFANSGAEANEGAIKIARKWGNTQKIKRNKIITLDNSFHGRTIATLKATAQPAMQKHFEPFPDGFIYAKDINEIENLLQDDVCAVMIELIQGEGGVEPQDKAQVQKLAKTLKEKDILLMVDEVQTGGYRTGEFLASNLYDISPQIITMAKGIGGGVPIGVVMSSLKDTLVFGDHGSTFGGNYLSCSASIAVLDILKKLYDTNTLKSTITYFNQKLDELFANNTDIFSSKVGEGLMLGLRVKDGQTLTNIIDNARQNGVLVLKAGRDTLRFLPPLTITKGEIDEGFKILNSSTANI